MSGIGTLVQQTTTGTGTGNLTVAAVSARRTLNTQFGTGGTDVFYYSITHRSADEWEYGTGHLLDATTLVRDTVIASSNANAAVNFSAGTKDVINDLPAVNQIRNVGTQLNVSLADAGADAFLGWDDTAGQYENLTATEAFDIIDTVDTWLKDVVADTTPQLGGALDGQGNDLNNLGVIFLTEQAAAEADVAGKGQIWVDTATPNVLMFTDDAGTDFQVGGAAAAPVTLAGTPDYITISNQVITRNAVDLAADVTGDLPFANLAQGSALSVLGVTGNSTADNASIAAGTDHQVLRRSGTAVAFGAVDLAQANAITGTLPAANLPAATTSAQGAVELIVSSEWRTGTDTARALGVAETWGAAALVALSSTSNSTAVDFASFLNATLSLGENSTLANPSNEKVGQSGLIIVTATGSTRTLNLHADWLPATSVEAFPISITTSQTAIIHYWIQAANTVRVLAVSRY